MFNQTLQNELERAYKEGFEIEAIIEGRTVFPSLMVEHIDNECVGFYDGDGSKITLLTDKLTGVIVHNRQPSWLQRELDLGATGTKNRERETARR